MRFVEVTVLLAACAGGANAQALARPYSVGVELMQPPGCSVFITAVLPHSPAEKAGLKPGDRVLRVDGDKVRQNEDAARLLRGSGPDKVRLRIRRGETEYQCTMPREKIGDIFARDGRKIVSGVVVPSSFTGTWIAARVFQGGYPLDATIFYPGFEVLVVPDSGRQTIDGLVIRGKREMIVGSVPPKGPAARAGIVPGDTIAAVDGAPLGAQSVDQVERMLSSLRPGTMHLDVRRGADTLSFVVPLETAPRVAAENGRRIVDGVAMPIWLVDGSAGCHPR